MAANDRMALFQLSVFILKFIVLKSLWLLCNLFRFLHHLTHASVLNHWTCCHRSEMVTIKYTDVLYGMKMALFCIKFHGNFCAMTSYRCVCRLEHAEFFVDYSLTLLSLQRIITHWGTCNRLYYCMIKSDISSGALCIKLTTHWKLGSVEI